MHLREQVDNQPARLRLIIETEIRPHARIHMHAYNAGASNTKRMYNEMRETHASC